MHTVLVEVSKEYPVVGLFGPRQSGKTTLARATFPTYQYISVEDEDFRSFAAQDPRGFLKRYRNDHGIIIGEIQRVPSLLSSIQTIVDEEWSVGTFVITGSHNMHLNESVSQSLSGRIGELVLLPLSIQELSQAELLPKTLDDAIFKGSYPQVYGFERRAERLYKNYIKTYVERDVKQIKNIDNLGTFKKFMQLCAGRVGQLLNYTSLANDCGIDVKTAKSWLNLLEAAYVIFLLQPYHKNFGKRAIQTPKLYFYDTGIACSLLRIRSAEALSDHYLKGNLSENYIVADFYKQYYNLDLEPAIYFWEDRAQGIDCIIEEPRGLQALEIKSSATITSSSFNQLTYFNTVAGTSPSSNYLIYGGDDVQERQQATVISWKKAGALIRTFI